MKFSEEQLEVMRNIENGATVWGYKDAKLIREIHNHDSNLIDIIRLPDLENITGEKFDGRGQLPYFGAILTDKGRDFLNQ